MAVKKKFPYRSAVVACNGGCRAAEGETGCKDGCIGCGACVNKCKFGAISINEYGVAEVDEEKCIACGACTKVCPQGVIDHPELYIYSPSSQNWSPHRQADSPVTQSSQVRLSPQARAAIFF